MVEVVHCKRCYPPWGQPGDVMIDRTTKWGNPFSMRYDNQSERDAVCNAYEKYFGEKELRGELNINELITAKRLGCWCKPKRCHGDYLKMRIDRIMDNSVDNNIEASKKSTFRDFGITNTKLVTKASSYINEKGDLVKTLKRRKKTVKLKPKRKMCKCKKK